MYDFEFIKPASLSEAITALAGEGAQALAGGMTLLPTLRQRLNQPARLVSINGLAELQGVSAADGVLTIGAATPHAVVARKAAAHYPAVAALAGQIGDPMVRNRGTIGGSLANNDPAACYPAAVLASGATIVTNRREIAVDDYFQGLFDTALDEGEVITVIRLRIPERAAYAKFAQPASRFALVGAFVAKYSDGVRVAITGAGADGVFRWTAAETALTADFSPAALAGVSMAAEGMVTDLHGSAAYRAHLVGVMTGRAVAAAG